MNELQNKNVYLACSKQLFNTPLFNRACEYIRAQEPKTFVEPSAMFASNREWKAAFPGYLLPFDICVVITDELYRVGKGAYMEVQWFWENGKSVYFFSECRGITQLIMIADTKVTNEDNWREYAQIVL